MNEIPTPCFYSGPPPLTSPHETKNLIFELLPFEEQDNSMCRNNIVDTEKMSMLQFPPQKFSINEP